MSARPTAAPGRSLMARARDDLAALVGLRTVAGVSPPEQFHRAARLIADLLVDAGLPEIRLLPADDGTETVYARRPGPPGAPRVVLYAHYDVVSAQDETAWRSPPFELTERDGRWYGRGSADCKGNVVAHLTALRSLQDALPDEPWPDLDLVVLVDGCEEPGDAALEKLLRARPDLLAPDVVVVADTGNLAPGVPTLTTSLRGMAVVEITVSTLARTLHSGQFGGPAPDALTALIRLLATLHDADGTPCVPGLGSASGPGPGRAGYSEAEFRADAGVLDGVRLIGSGTVAERLWDRPAVTVLAVRSPSLDDAVPALLPSAKALVSVRTPPGTEVARVHEALAGHLREHVPWGARLDIRRVTSGPAFRADTGGPAHTVMREALSDAFGVPAREVGAGGSIAVCSAFRSLYPDAEIVLCGVEDPPSNIHGTDESVSPGEIAALARAEALFLRRLAAARTGRRAAPTGPREDR
ncbi:M20/M25/M40 family metallo-hydrolase [Streptomyces sp. DSM 41014]|uniref:M20/M25/M40 family metallo-hydrolase n=1 Tax=Streptomyces hintoniae TaxID=3075521 RepID=A0ABU2UH34_9ACTN|nr:M20/M25/M40 family metallo-hydrolase [Streptomyces sp. DSM 41014]MDT0472405.1 M20/M25/M40 family metallo-hydrolase [Streptomyces sp. DSM 41014]